MSTQLWPHDGVAALAVPAVSVPARPAPPTMVSVAAAASTLVLMDMEGCSSLNSQLYPARGCVERARAAHVGFSPDSLGTLPARGGLVRPSLRPAGLTVWRGKDPGKPGGLHGTGGSPFPHGDAR